MTFLRTLVCVLVGLGATNLAQAAGAPLALVMELEGATTPRVEVHQELAADARITLGKNARIAVLHYPKCTIFAVRGGTLQATESGVEVGSGTIETTRPGPCPRVQRVTVAGLASGSGAVLSRAIGPAAPTLSLAANDDIVLAGPLASRAVSSELLDLRGATVLGTTPVRTASIRLPGAHMLVTGETYQLRIRLEGSEQPVNVTLAIVETRADGPLILRLE